MFLGGVHTNGLQHDLGGGETMAAFSRRAGISYVGYAIEYQLNEGEDLKIMSLFIQDGTQKRYTCRCTAKNKLPMHIYHVDTVKAIEILTYGCDCNRSFEYYYK